MNQVLLLDRNYMALSVISWKKAIKLLINKKVESVSDVVNVKVTAGGTIFYLPSVLRLLVTIPWKIYQNRIKFTRKNVMIRDCFTCQYCGIKLTKHNGTIDHVIPRSMGGITSYTNCVACCSKCNAKKTNKLSEDAGMILMSRPRKPNFIISAMGNLCSMPDEWLMYIVGK